MSSSGWSLCDACIAHGWGAYGKAASPALLVWAIDDGDESHASKVAHESPLRAAQIFAEHIWASSDYPDEQEICVKDKAGAYHAFTVTTHRQISFQATPKRTG